jgi:hypothetical protein
MVNSQIVSPEQSQASSILSDQPSQQDHLDFSFYVNALHNSIINRNTTTPLTLGVFGRWGTGKSTLMHMLEAQLEADGLTVIWFNAWQYDKEDELWAAFIQSTINKIQNKFHFFRRWLFNAKLLMRRLRWNLIPGFILRYLFRIIVVILPLLLVDPLTGNLQPAAQTLIQAGGSLMALILAIGLVIRPFISVIRDNVNINFQDLRQNSDYQTHIAFLDKFREHFADIVQSLPGSDNKKLAVFIDDLDRCASDRVLQVLDAVKLFVDIPGSVYVLGLDAEIVQKAVATKYPDDAIAQQEYIGKIVQLPFHLPQLTYNGMKKFINELPLDLPDNRCREVFIAGLQQNPREVKRAINVFSLVWNLASNRPEIGMRPVCLAKVVVIQHGHQDLYRVLQDRPDLLIELELYFRRMQVSAQTRTREAQVLPKATYVDKYDLAALRESLSKSFNLEELKTICFDLGISYDEFSGETKQAFIRELLVYLQRRQRLDEFIKLINEQRPDVETGSYLSNKVGVPDNPISDQTSFNISLDLEPFVKNNRLRRMLLLHYPTESETLPVENECNFANLDAADVESYFTLTSRAEAPLPSTSSVK